LIKALASFILHSLRDSKERAVGAAGEEPTKEVPQSQPDQRLGGCPHTAVSTGTIGEPQEELPRVVPLWGPDVVEQLSRQPKGTWSHPRPRTNECYHVPKNAPTHLGNPGVAQMVPAHGKTREEEGHVRHYRTPQEEHHLHCCCHCHCCCRCH
jgi:hypothetical protein